MKILKYTLLAIAIGLIGYLGYRYIYTMYTGPSDEKLEEDKKHDDNVVVPDAFDKLNESFDEDSTLIDSTHTDTLR